MSTTTRPNALAPFAEKIKPEYGQKVAEFISQEWFNGGMISNTTKFMTRRDWIIEQRLYARGEQDTQSYKDVVARQSGDLSYLNLDWRIINVCEKFCNIVSNGISDEYYKIDVRATDRYTLLGKKKRIMQHKVNMKSLPMLQKAKEQLGVDLIPNEYIPQDEDDLNFHTMIKDRPMVEIAEEKLINVVKSYNDWKNIKEQCDKDIVECGLMAAQVYTDPINGVSLRYVDIENAVHSYVTKNDFSDAFYYGFVDTITISDIKRESNDTLTDTQLRDIAKSYSANSTGKYVSMDFSKCNFDEIIDVKVHVLRFAWKTNKSIIYKQYNKKGIPSKVAKRSEEYLKPEVPAKNKICKTYDTWLEGNMIVGSKFIYGYQESENIVKDEMNKVLSPFIFRATNIYKNKLHSFLSNIKALCDQMQYAHLKIQHLMAELKPDLLNIDIDALADLGTAAKGGEKQSTWKEALSILNVKGVVISKRVDLGEGGMKEAQGAKPMPMSQGTALAQLLNVWAHYYNLVREITGINPARDGSLPADALLGVNKMAQLASNTVTKHIVNAANDFDLKVCMTISSRLKAIFTFKEEAKHLIQLYTQAVGKESIEAMKAMENRHLNDFGFTMSLYPSIEELTNFKEDLSIALKEGTIDVEDKIEAEQIAKVSIKEANEYLKFARKRRMKKMMEEKQAMIKEQTQGNIASTQAATQAKIQEKITQAKIDVDKEGKMSQIRLAEKQAMIQIESPVNQKEFEQEVYLKKLDSITQFDNKKYIEDAKDKRIDKQSTQQSKMIEQRQNNTVPIDFESEFDFDEDFE